MHICVGHTVRWETQHSTACVSEAEPCCMHASHCLTRNAIVYCTDRLRLRGQPVMTVHSYPDVFIPLLFTSASCYICTRAVEAFLQTQPCKLLDTNSTRKPSLEHASSGDQTLGKQVMPIERYAVTDLRNHPHCCPVGQLHLNMLCCSMQ